MVKTIADKMVDFFLSWKIPSTFSPDCYVNFEKENALADNSWPTGTNIFNAEETKLMIKHMGNCDILLNEYLTSKDGYLYVYNAKVDKIVDADTVDH